MRAAGEQADDRRTGYLRAVAGGRIRPDRRTACDRSCAWAISPGRRSGANWPGPAARSRYRGRLRPRRRGHVLDAARSFSAVTTRASRTPSPAGLPARCLTPSSSGHARTRIPADRRFPSPLPARRRAGGGCAEVYAAIRRRATCRRWRPRTRRSVTSRCARRPGEGRQVTMAELHMQLHSVCVANVYLVAYNSPLPDSAECLNKQRKMGYDFRAPVAQGKRRAP